jgi:hypothetical protein
VTDALDDTALLDALGASLAPAPSEPSVAAIEALHQALEQRNDRSADVLSPVIPLLSAGRWGRRGGPLHRLRHPAAVAAAVAVLATSGMAAAAVATDHLPGPTRAVAYDLGLPVTSPGLAHVQGTLAGLQAALAAGDVSRVRASAALLRSQIAMLSPSDEATVRIETSEALTRADALLATPSQGDRHATSGPGSDDNTVGGSGRGSGSSSRTGSDDGSGGGSGSGGSGVSGGSSGGSDSGSGDTATTDPRSDDGSTGTAPGSGGGSGGGTDDGSGDDSGGGSGSGSNSGSNSGSEDGPGATTTSAPGATPTTTPGHGSGHGGSDDGSGSQDDAGLSTSGPSGS